MMISWQRAITARVAAVCDDASQHEWQGKAAKSSYTDASVKTLQNQRNSTRFTVLDCASGLAAIMLMA
jgi:hypothetical protein